MSLNLRFEISADVISTEAPLEETLLMNTQTLAYYGLDPLGSKLWRLMQSCQDADEIIQQAVATTGKSQQELEQVMRAILSGMAQSRLLSVTKMDVVTEPTGV